MSDERIRDGAIRKTIDDFTGGYNLYSDPSKIRESEFQIFENLIVNRPGRFLNANKRFGFERWNFNRTATTENINSIFEIIWKTKSLNNRILVKTKDSLEYCDNNAAAFTAIATGLPESKMKALMYKDNVYIANNDSGDDANTFYDGTNYLEIGCPPCMQNMVLSLSSTASSNLGTGVYHYLVAYLYDGNMESGVILRHLNSNDDTNNELTVNISREELYTAHIDNSTGKKINIAAIPIGNERVTARVIYRTESDGDTFYYLTTISDNSTSILLNDDVPDTELGIEYNGGDGFKNILKPYKSKYHVVHQGRLWQANLKEDQYEALDVTGVSGASEAGSGHISANGTRQAAYTYKFAKDIRIIKGKTFDGATGTMKPPYTGIFGAISEGKRIVSTATHTEIYLSDIPIDEFCQRTAVLRNCCQFITGIAVSGSTLTVTVAVAWVFKEGETVTISGVSETLPGPNGPPTGEFVINTVTATTFKITWDNTGGTYTANTGIAEGGNFYICGFSRGGTFRDGYADSYMAGTNFSVTTATGDKSYKSSVISSEADQPDIFPSGNFMNIGQDNGEEITGIFSDERRLIVFKENSIYEIDTTYQDTSYARARRVVRSVGAKDGYAIVQIGTGEFIFLGSDNYFYHWKGSGMPQPISIKIQTIIDNLEYTNLDCCYYPKLKWVIFTYSTMEVKGNVLIYDLSVSDGAGEGTWYHFTKNQYDLSLCAPYVTKDRNLLFGNVIAGYIFTYGAATHDNLITRGTTNLEDVNIKISITTKLFKDYNTVKRIFTRIQTNGAGAGNAFSLFCGTDSESALSSTLVSGLNVKEHKVNVSGREFYMRLENEDDLDVSIKELGFEYIPAHKAGEV